MPNVAYWHYFSLASEGPNLRTLTLIFVLVEKKKNETLVVCYTNSNAV